MTLENRKICCAHKLKKINIVKMATLTKTIYRLNSILIKILMLFFTERKTILKWTCNCWRDGSAIISTYYSSRGVKFSSQQLCGWLTTAYNSSSRLSDFPVLSGHLHSHAHALPTHIYTWLKIKCILKNLWQQMLVRM